MRSKFHAIMPHFPILLFLFQAQAILHRRQLIQQLGFWQRRWNGTFHLFRPRSFLRMVEVSSLELMIEGRSALIAS